MAEPGSRAGRAASPVLGPCFREARQRLGRLCTKGSQKPSWEAAAGCRGERGAGPAPRSLVARPWVSLGPFCHRATLH